MTDLIERLKEHCSCPDLHDAWEAKAEIERLRAALETVVDSIYCDDGYRNVSISEEAEKIAREALKDD